MRVLVTGGRNYADAHTLWGAMEAVRPSVVIHGSASGADLLAGAWCEENEDVELLMFPADWDLHGRAAGPIRNQRMLEQGQPDLVLAFPGGRGTRDMVERARKAGVPVLLSSDWVFQGEGS